MKVANLDMTDSHQHCPSGLVAETIVALRISAVKMDGVALLSSSLLMVLDTTKFAAK